jgi:tRNA pseudouridine32 synthase/23S rRNA pseudouridine746 synthase
VNCSVFEFRAVYRDDQLLVLDKPSGMLAVPGRGPELQDCLARRVQAEFPSALIVHRLDRDTSGLIVMALHAQTHRELGRQFESRQVHKTYVAVVEGQVEPDEGRIDLPLGKDFEHPPRHKVDPLHGRSAITLWRVVERQGDRTKLELEPLTGRSHQLRVHLAALGHAILGDKLYASAIALAMAERLQLHASELSLVHPVTGNRMTFTSPCPF